MIRMRSHQQDLLNVMTTDIGQKRFLKSRLIAVMLAERHNEFQGDEVSCNDLDLEKEF